LLLMARIEFIDQSLRDGQQSLWGMRIRAGHILPMAPLIDAAGYRVVDLTGSSPFEVQVRYNLEDPWAGLDAVRAAFPRTPLRAGSRSNGVVGMGITPDSIVELWVRTLAKHGIRSFWIFDCLHNVDQMLRVAAIARDAGMTPSPQVNFSLSPVHTDEHYAQIMKRFADSDVPATIVLGDEAGVLHPERARTWVRLMRATARDSTLEAHFHNKTAMGTLNHIIAVEEGVHILHTAVDSLANGPSMPSTAMAIDNMRRLGHEVTLDDRDLAEVSEHFRALAVENGHHVGAPVEYSVATVQQQFPGGMTGTLRNQLVTYGMADRLPAVLEEAVRVRAEMGYPIMATPFSQLVGIQALLNVVQGERYLTIPDENLMFLAGHYGRPPGELDHDLLDRAFSTDRGRVVRDTPPAQPSLREIREQYGTRLSDEELLLRYLIPGPDVDRMYAAEHPIAPVYPIGGAQQLGWIRDLLSAGSARTIRANRGDVEVELRR
jgi:oxaloacetate decarboxylase (Na+ extruding) subunit alpha